MKVLLREAPPKEVMNLVKQATQEAISPLDFCKKLEKLGIAQPMFAAYLTNFFDIDYLTARSIVLKIRFGETKAGSNYGAINDENISIMHIPLKACNNYSL